jgi:hypothetical protein
MQSRRAGIAVAVLGVAVAIVLFVVLSGGDDDDSSPETTTTTVATTTGGGQNNNNTTTTTTVEPEVATIEIRDGEPVGGAQELSFDAGDDIRFRVESNAAWEIHLHGYDVSEEVEAGGSVEFDVPATAEGVFEVEIEQTATPIAEVTVNP